MNSKKYWKLVLGSVKEVWFDRKSKLLMIGLFSLFLILNAFIREFSLIGSTLFSSLKVFFEGVYYSLRTVPFFTGLVIVLLSFLSALLITMVVYGFRKNQEMTALASGGSKGAASSGVILSLLAPACPACGISLFSLFGFGSLGAFLPLGGQEFSILAVFLLVLSIGYVGKRMSEESCRI